MSEGFLLKVVDLEVGCGFCGSIEGLPLLRGRDEEELGRPPELPGGAGLESDPAQGVLHVQDVMVGADVDGLGMEKKLG